MKLFGASLISIALIVSCTQSSSDPCEYDILEFKAKVIGFENYVDGDKEYIHVVMKFDRSSLSEKDQYFDELKSIKIDQNFIDRNKIKKGFVYKGTISEIMSGDCQPIYITFNHKFH